MEGYRNDLEVCRTYLAEMKDWTRTNCPHNQLLLDFLGEMAH